MKRLMTLIFSLGLFVCGLLASEDYSQQIGVQGFCSDGTCSTGVCPTGNCNSCSRPSSSQIYYSTPQPISRQYNYVPQNTYPSPTYSTAARCNVPYTNGQPCNVTSFPQPIVSYPSVQYTPVSYQPVQAYPPVTYSQPSCNQVQYASQPVVYSSVPGSTPVYYSSAPVQYSSASVQNSQVVNVAQNDELPCRAANLRVGDCGANGHQPDAANVYDCGADCGTCLFRIGSRNELPALLLLAWNRQFVDLHFVSGVGSAKSRPGSADAFARPCRWRTWRRPLRRSWLVHYFGPICHSKLLLLGHSTRSPNWRSPRFRRMLVCVCALPINGGDR